MRVIPVFLAALLVFAAVGVGTPAPPSATVRGDADAVATAPDAVTATATTIEHNASGAIRVLELNQSEPATADVDVVTIEAGTATALDANSSAARIETIALRERIEGANASDERQKEILDGLNEVEKDVITLHSERRAAIASYANGDISARQLLVELAEVRASANVLAERVRIVSRLAERSDDVSVDRNRVARLELDLRTFDGPVRSRSANALAGDRLASTRVYVAATEHSVTLSTVVDGQYVRETFRGDLRSRDTRGIDEVTAQNVTAQSYPEIWAAAGGEAATLGSGGTFISTLQYPNGTLTAFVGGGSEQVFMEHQQIDLGGIKHGPTATRTLDVSLVVNRTFPGGPLRVAVVDPATGDPIDAVVKIQPEDGASTEVGTTGDDGVLWTVSPRGEFVVTVVEVGSTDVSFVSVAPTEPKTVAETLDSNGGSASAEPPE
ncbi:DUF7096 domain-containing protein [Halobaculum marinum]|uniref:Carboxypeptidase regulatory-like domain-containing protein n=1 Tax=Halobaculum marinum TaxID=3031996 RepID=A0ABD5X0B9_9EURY|nr:hypothetical protein [Halobaculum sp. DT55]